MADQTVARSIVSITVELCGKLGEPCGREITLTSPPDGCTAAELVARVRASEPALGAMLVAGRVRVCVNETVVPDDARIVPGDRVALFPPVSGG